MSAATRAAAAAVLCLAAVTARAGEVHLLFASGSPTGSEVSVDFMKPWVDRINSQAKGVLHIDYREGFALANPANSYDRVLSDAFQIGFMLPGLVAGTFPRTQVVTLPYVAGNSAEAASVALWRIYAHGPLATEYRRIQPLAISAISQASIHMAKPLSSPLALKGVKLMATSKTAADVAAHLDAAPISLPIFQVYEALVRHTVDGVITGWPSFQPFKLIEVTRYHIDAPLGSSVAMIFMAKKKYDSLPAAARKILDANSGETASRAYGRMWDEVAARARRQIAATPGQQLVVPTKAETAAIRKKIEPVIDDWLAATPGGKETLVSFTAALAAVHDGN